MKIATWNVNSVRAREERLRRWLRTGRPDVVCLQEVGTEKWTYKLEWLRRLRAWLDRRFPSRDEPLALCGDFNVVPEARDVCDPPAWERTVLFHPEVRKALEHVRAWGLVDAFRLHHPEAGFYSWWDYRQLAFPRNQGLRIDLVLLSW